MKNIMLAQEEKLRDHQSQLALSTGKREFVSDVV